MSSPSSPSSPSKHDKSSFIPFLSPNTLAWPVKFGMSRPGLSKVNYLSVRGREGGREGGDWICSRRRLQPGLRVLDRSARVVSPTDGDGWTSQY